LQEAERAMLEPTLMSRIFSSLRISKSRALWLIGVKEDRLYRPKGDYLFGVTGTSRPATRLLALQDWANIPLQSSRFLPVLLAQIHVL
jgi:hypothetical protein